MSMINTIQAHVIGFSRYEVEGTKGGKITVMNEAPDDSENVFGFQVSTMSAPYNMVDKIREMNPRLPGNLEFDVEIKPSGGRISFHAIAVREIKPGRPGDTKSDSNAGNSTSKTS